jgi:hypothetical protein
MQVATPSEERIDADDLIKELQHKYIGVSPEEFYEVESLGCGFYDGMLYPIKVDGYLDHNQDMAVHPLDLDMDVMFSLSDEECIRIGIPRNAKQLEEKDNQQEG